MAVFKTSNHRPNLQEVNYQETVGADNTVTKTLSDEENLFSCIVNTSGEPIKAYKIDILSPNGDSIVTESSLDDSTMNQNDTFLIKNKHALEIKLKQDNIKTLLDSNQDQLQWGVRVYNKNDVNDKKIPNTLVCDGFVTGSTKNVIWCQIPENDSSLNDLVYDNYIEFNNIPIANQIQYLKDNKDEDVKVPKEGFTQRLKIDWVTKGLGKKKNIVKIETDKPFDYSFKDGTPFSIYRCSDEHTKKNVFIEPNSEINLADYIYIVDIDAELTRKESEITNLPAGSRKIVGYSSDTGEVRVHEPFLTVPENGQKYQIFRYNPVSKKYKEVYKSYDDQLVGGKQISNEIYKVFSNYYHERIFIQPNINIKLDAKFPQEIVFKSNMQETYRIPIKPDEVTIDKLDNTQWLLSSGLIHIYNLNGVSMGSISTETFYKIFQPQMDYQVVSSFMDSTPYSIFFLKKEPELKLQLREHQAFGDNNNKWSDLVNGGTYNYREIEFKTLVDGESYPDIKYYYYILFDNNDNIIEQSPNIYNNDLTWLYRGFDRESYKIKCVIVDSYEKSFSIVNNFQIQYVINDQSHPNIYLDCHEKAIALKVNSPLELRNYNNQDIQNGQENFMEQVDVVGNFNSNEGLTIPSGKILKYGKVTKDPNTPFEVITSNPVYFSSIFQITPNFIHNIPVAGAKKVLGFSLGTGLKVEYELYLTSNIKESFKEKQPQGVTKQPQEALAFYLKKKGGTGWETKEIFKQRKSNFLPLNEIFKDLEQTTPEKVNYALLNREQIDNNNSQIYKYIPVSTLPTSTNGINENDRYVLKSDVSQPGSNSFRSAGIYKYVQNEGWKLSSEYNAFVDSEDNVFAGGEPQKISLAAKDSKEGKEFKYIESEKPVTDSSEIYWIDSNAAFVNLAGQILKDKWLKVLIRYSDVDQVEWIQINEAKLQQEGK